MGAVFFVGAEAAPTQVALAGTALLALCGVDVGAEAALTQVAISETRKENYSNSIDTLVGKAT